MLIAKLNLGGTLLAHQALVNGDIDLYPEYTGTALTTVLKLPPAHDPAAAMALVRAEYQARFGVEWMDPLGFNNTFAMVIRGEDARKNKIATLSDAARYSPGWNLGVGYEFQQRSDGLAGLLKTYQSSHPGIAQDHGPRIAVQGTRTTTSEHGGRECHRWPVVGSGCAGSQDDKRYFPPYDCALAVRPKVLRTTLSCGKPSPNWPDYSPTAPCAS